MKNYKIRKFVQRIIGYRILRFIDPTSYKIEQFANSMREELPLGAKILDAGAGEAPYRKSFYNYSYTSIDTQWGDPDFDYSRLDIVGNLENLPFSKDIFDGILCTQVLEHVAEPYLVLKEIHRVLKPFGIIYLSAPQGWGVHQTPYDYFRFTHYGLKYLFEKAEFEIQSIKSTCGYFGYLANRLTVLPKTLFWQIKKKGLRLILIPFELLSYLIFVLILPLILNSIDFLDSNQNYTLNYMVKARKK